MLSPEQIAARKGKLTASRIAPVMTGDRNGIMDVYRELTDDPTWEPPDFTDHLPVRIGEATESVNLEWYERSQRSALSRMGEVAIHPQVSWAACTLDAWDDTLQCPVECKHIGGREPIEVVIDRYQPQGQWQCYVTDAKQWAISLLIGNDRWLVEYIPRDDDYIIEMVRRAKQFMYCVERRRPPVVLDPAPPPIIADKIYEMGDNETWQRYSSQWIQVKGAAEVAKDCEKVLKSLVPEDAKKCWGWGTRITRDRAGRLSLREDK